MIATFDHGKVSILLEKPVAQSEKLKNQNETVFIASNSKDIDVFFNSL